MTRGHPEDDSAIMMAPEADGVLHLTSPEADEDLHLTSLEADEDLQLKSPEVEAIATHECAEADALSQTPSALESMLMLRELAASTPMTPVGRRLGAAVQFDSSSSLRSVRNSSNCMRPKTTPRPRLHSSSSRPSVNDKMSQMNLSFAGCGFLGVYHIGVAACIKRYCPVLLKRKISGASAGAIAAAALICETSLNTVMSDLVQVARKIQDHVGGPFSPFVSVPSMLRAGLVRNLPDNAHVLCSGRLHISVTRLRDGKNCILSQFDTKEELITALMCTAFIPGFSGFAPPFFRGERYMDGCYSNNLPTLDDRTITVSPFCGEADICPRDMAMNVSVICVANTPVEMTSENFMRMFMIMYPPSPETLSELANQGFNDAIRFLMRHDLMKCQVCVMTTEIVGRAYSSCGQLITHQHCDDCSHKQQEAMLSKLPAHVHEPLYQNIISSRRAFRNWLLDFPGVRHVLILAVPWTIPYKIIKMLYRRLVREIPQLANLVEGMTSEVVRAVHDGFSGHLPHSQRLHARYTCRVNVTEYGESAGLEEGQTDIDESEYSLQVPSTNKLQAPLAQQQQRYVPGFVRSFDREFRVDFTKSGCSTMVRTSSDAERLESEVITADTEDAVPGIEVVEAAERTQEEAFDRDVVRMALEAQAEAECGVSWYYTDKEGNVRVRHVSAVPTPVATPCASRRASVCDELPLVPRRTNGDDPLTQALLAASQWHAPSRRSSFCEACGDTEMALADEAEMKVEEDTEGQREEEVTYNPGMGVIKEEANDMLPED